MQRFFARSILAGVLCAFAMTSSPQAEQPGALTFWNILNDPVAVTLICGDARVVKNGIKTGTSANFYNEGSCMLTGIVQTPTTTFTIRPRAYMLNLSRPTQTYAYPETPGNYVFQ